MDISETLLKLSTQIDVDGIGYEDSARWVEFHGILVILNCSLSHRSVPLDIERPDVVGGFCTLLFLQLRSYHHAK